MAKITGGRMTSNPILDHVRATPWHQSTDDNERRYRRAKLIYDLYAEACYGLEEDRENVYMVASDLISDILHVVHANPQDDPDGMAAVESVLSKARDGFLGDNEDGPYFKP